MIENHPSLHGSGVRPRQHRKGQTLVEYALVLALISVVAIAVLSAMGGHVKGVFTTISSQLAAAKTGGPVTAPPAFGG